MANNLTISTASKQAALDALTALINVGGAGSFKIYDGAQPAGPNTAVSSQNLLATCPLSATAFGATNSSGVATANAITPSTGSANVNGTAAWFRVFSGGGVAIVDGTVGTTGCDLNLGSTTISTGVPVSITSFTLSHP